MCERGCRDTGAVNSVLYVDFGRRIVSCADDKTLRVFESVGPTQIKCVTDPDMHSLVCLRPHPSQPTFLAQSMDNQILVYGCKGGKLKLETSKYTYKGHVVAGYGIEASFSADGRFVSSGDAEGKMWVWDLKTLGIVKKFQAHSKALITHTWYPGHASTLVTGGWDGAIRVWQ